MQMTHLLRIYVSLRFSLSHGYITPSVLKIEMNLKKKFLLKATIQKNDKNMKIKLKHPEHVYVILASGNDETYDENDEDEEESETVESDQEYTYIYHSVSNLKSLHMMTKVSFILK